MGSPWAIGIAVRAAAEDGVGDVNMGAVPNGAINPRDYRFVMSLARRYNAIVFWHRDRNGIDWQPLLLPLSPRSRPRPDDP
ncbi:MAG TPA: hypothetical protein VJZ50_09970 [Candidatus Limnocylindrales bacterium]|nr:hypothetical protein [Candidatus Limnocylindrales bacterium]